MSMLQSHVTPAPTQAPAPSRPTAQQGGPGNQARLELLPTGASVDPSGEQDSMWASAVEQGALEDEASVDDPEVLAEADKSNTRDKGDKERRRRGGRDKDRDENQDEYKEATAPKDGGGLAPAMPTPASLQTGTLASNTSAPAPVAAPRSLDLPDLGHSLDAAFASQVSAQDALREGALDEVVELDRDALIGEASGSMGAAAMGAGMNLGVDTALDVATSKIPFVSGFIELGKMALDPKGWVADMVAGYTGSFGKMSDLDMKDGASIGKVADFMEGVLAVISGASHTVGMITMVLTIAASICFGLCWIPGLQFLAPIAAFLTTWAVLLGTIGTLMGLFVTAMHAVMMNLRIAELKTSDDDPSALLDAADSLEEHAGAFVGGAITRMGDGMRKRGKKKASKKSNGASGESGAAKVKADTADGGGGTKAPTTGDKVKSGAKGVAKGANTAVNVLGGALGGGDEKGKGKAFQGGAGSLFGDIGKQMKKTKKVTGAMFGKGKASKALRGKGDFQERMSAKALDMEAAGATVFVGDKHKNAMTRGKGALTDYADDYNRTPYRADTLLDAHEVDTSGRFERHQAARDAIDSTTHAAIQDSRQQVDDHLWSKHGGRVDLDAISGPEEDHGIFSHQAMGSGATGWGANASGLGSGIVGELSDLRADRRTEDLGASPALTEREKAAQQQSTRERRLDEAAGWLDKAGLRVGYLDPDYADKSVMDIVEERKGPDRKTLVAEAMQAEGQALTDAPLDSFAAMHAACERSATLDAELSDLHDQSAHIDVVLDEASEQQVQAQARLNGALALDAAALTLGGGLEDNGRRLQDTRRESQDQQSDLDDAKDQANELAGSGLMKTILDAIAKMDEMGGLGDKADKDGGSPDNQQAGDGVSLSNLVVQAMDAASTTLDDQQADGVDRTTEAGARSHGLSADMQAEATLAEQDEAEVIEAQTILAEERQALIARGQSFAADRDTAFTELADHEARVREWTTDRHPQELQAAELNLQARFPWLSLDV